MFTRLFTYWLEPLLYLKFAAYFKAKINETYSWAVNLMVNESFAYHWHPQMQLFGYLVKRVIPKIILGDY